MDFDRFLENLPGDYKTLLLSIACIFPMAYIDCWKISCGFAEIELFKQIILAAGISVMLTIAGYILDLTCMNQTGLSKVTDSLNMPVIVIPTVFTTTSLFIYPTISPLMFLFRISGVILIGGSVVIICSRRGKEGNPQGGVGSGRQQDAHESAGDPHEDDRGDSH